MKIKKHMWDIIVISALLLVAVAALLAVNLTREDGKFVTVEINGNVCAEYSLSQNGVFPLNGGTNILVIENGEAYLSYSNCPDHTCERTGRIHHVGQAIICLPNRLSVTVRGDSTDNAPDLIS